MAKDGLPSKNVKDWWIFSVGKKNELHSSLLPKEQGKWLIFVKRDEIDEIWNVIKKADESGKLGTGAKVSTKKASEKSPTSSKDKTHVICVYTKNCNNEEDAMGVRNELKRLGITWKIYYKSNEATRRGKYATKGDRRISMYSA